MDLTRYTIDRDLKQLERFIIQELQKRGIYTSIATIKEVTDGPRKDKNRIIFKTNEIQTIPNLFKKLWVQEFNSGFFRHTPEKSSRTFDCISISIHYRWEVYSGGSNGTELLNLTCKIDEDEEFANRLFDFKVC